MYSWPLFVFLFLSFCQRAVFLYSTCRVPPFYFVSNAFLWISLQYKNNTIVPNIIFSNQLKNECENYFLKSMQCPSSIYSLKHKISRNVKVTIISVDDAYVIILKDISKFKKEKATSFGYIDHLSSLFNEVYIVLIC